MKPAINPEELARFLLFAMRFPVPRFPVPKPGPNAQAEHDAQMTEARVLAKKMLAADALYDTLKELHFCLEQFLDAHGALRNPSELDGYGLSLEEQTRILAALPKAQIALALADGKEIRHGS